MLGLAVFGRSFVPEAGGGGDDFGVITSRPTIDNMSPQVGDILTVSRGSDTLPDNNTVDLFLWHQGDAQTMGDPQLTTLTYDTTYTVREDDLGQPLFVLQITLAEPVVQGSTFIGGSIMKSASTAAVLAA